jgi:hypothetical protein
VTVLDALRDYLVAEGLVRAPDVAGAGARPWPPPAWRHPDEGAIGPGDAADAGRPDVAHDDGLVVSLMAAPGIPPTAGDEDRRQDGVDIVIRTRAVPPAYDLENEIRKRLMEPDPGGRIDWMMGGLYVVQSRQWRPWQPISATAGVYTFSVGYIIETRT